MNPSKKSKLIRMIDELITQFNQNKYILTQLIHYRHYIRNIFNDKIIEETIAVFIDKYKDRIASKDYSIFEDTPVAIDAKIIWELLDQNNKIVLWKWINFICN